jgi:hypothetical protein
LLAVHEPHRDAIQIAAATSRNRQGQSTREELPFRSVEHVDEAQRRRARVTPIGYRI